MQSTSFKSSDSQLAAETPAHSGPTIHITPIIAAKEVSKRAATMLGQRLAQCHYAVMTSSQLGAEQTCAVIARRFSAKLDLEKKVA
jgi:hypothetical protein